MSICRTVDENNYKQLLKLNFFLGVGISIVSSNILFDLLYLRMQFDLAWFGMLRSCMFLLPGLSYFCLAPCLKGTPYSREIVQWSYLVRIGIAIVIPLAALCTDSKKALFGIAVVCTTIAFIAAAFANNTLMVLYRQLLPQEEFNRKNAAVNSVFAITPSVFSLLGAGILSLASELPNRSFFALFLVLELGTGIFELQLFRINRKLKLLPTQVGPVHCLSFAGQFKQAFAGLRSPVYRQLLMVTVTGSFFSALLDTYFSVFLYKVHNASAFTMLLLINVAVFGSNFASILAGQWCDRVGYLQYFRKNVQLIIALTIIFSFFLDYRWVVIAFLLLVFNGSIGLVAGALLTLRGAAAAKLAPVQGGESYVAAYALITMLGSFAGSLGAGWLFSLCQAWTGGEITQTFSLYFKLVGASGFMMLLPLYGRGSRLLDKKRA